MTSSPTCLLSVCRHELYLPFLQLCVFTSSAHVCVRCFLFSHETRQECKEDVPRVGWMKYSTNTTTSACVAVN